MRFSQPHPYHLYVNFGNEWDNPEKGTEIYFASLKKEQFLNNIYQEHITSLTGPWEKL